MFIQVDEDLGQRIYAVDTDNAQSLIDKLTPPSGRSPYVDVFPFTLEGLQACIDLGVEVIEYPESSLNNERNLKNEKFQEEQKMKVQRKRFAVMRRARTEIWCGLGRNFYFKPINKIEDTAVKTYHSEAAAKACGSGDREFEIIPVIETIEILEEQNESRSN